MPLVIPQLKKRTALLRKLKECFRRAQSQPTEELISTINPILRGWVNYFANGTFESLFLLHPQLGREEDPTTPGQSPKTLMASAGSGGVGNGCTGPGALR